MNGNKQFLLLLFGVTLISPAVALAAPLSQDAGEGSLLTSLLPLILVAVVVALSIGRKLFAGGGGGAKPVPSEPGRLRNYGAAGGAVCRQCGLAFPRGIMDPNLLVGKLTRCPHCGKWAVLPAASLAELSVAEARERHENQGEGSAPTRPQDLSQEEQLRKQIENSKYE